MVQKGMDDPRWHNLFMAMDDVFINRLKSRLDGMSEYYKLYVNSTERLARDCEFIVACENEFDIQYKVLDSLHFDNADLSLLSESLTLIKSRPKGFFNFIFSKFLNLEKDMRSVYYDAIYYNIKDNNEISSSNVVLCKSTIEQMDLLMNYMIQIKLKFEGLLKLIGQDMLWDNNLNFLFFKYIFTLQDFVRIQTYWLDRVTQMVHFSELGFEQLNQNGNIETAIAYMITDSLYQNYRLRDRSNLLNEVVFELLDQIELLKKKRGNVL